MYMTVNNSLFRTRVGVSLGKELHQKGTDRGTLPFVCPCLPHSNFQGLLCRNLFFFVVERKLRHKGNLPITNKLQKYSLNSGKLH